jgi:hypothetical protein
MRRTSEKAGHVPAFLFSAGAVATVPDAATFSRDRTREPLTLALPRVPERGPG